MPFYLTLSQHERIVEHARAEFPLECCGLIGGEKETAREVYPARNADQSRSHYTIEPSDMLRATRDIEDVNNWDISAFYHSHPMSDAFPSPTDVREAVCSGYSEHSRFIIVSLLNTEQPKMRCFWLRGGVIYEDPLVNSDEPRA